MATNVPQLPADRRAPVGPAGADSPKDSPPDASGPSGGVEAGEYIDIGAVDGDEITDAPDGGLFITIGEAVEQKPLDEGFYSNLAEVIPPHVQDRVVTDLLQKISEDKEARKKRDEQYEEGIKRTGLGKDAPGGAEFEGASRVVHPMMTEACIDYESRIIKELYPPAGPVKKKIVGVVTAEKDKKAQRVVEHMNWQITTQIKEARSVLETTLTQVPLGGSQFIRQWWDHRLMRPRWSFVPIDNVYLPFGAADFTSATRKTYAEKISAIEFKQRVDQGLYLDLALPAPSQQPDTSKAAAASHKAEGVEDPGMNLDGDREIYETMTYLEVTREMADVLDGEEEEGKLYPYLLTIDVSTRKLLSMYRDWEDDDKAKEPIEHLFEFPFIPWRGAYSIGFPQIIGSLSGGATGALRALLDSAHANNASGGFILKGSGASGQSRSPAIGTFTEIDGGLECDDIRKRVLPFAMNQPSPVLFQLLGFLVDTSKGIVRTSLDETSIDTNANVPVGTQLSRVEEGLVVFSAVHGRAHAAMDRLLAGLHRLNKLYLPETLRVDAKGTEILVRRSDYEGPCDVQPVSDATIYSDQQRFWQITAIQQRAAQVPGLYNVRKVEERFLRLMKIADPAELLVESPQPHELNAVNENLAMALGQPVVAFPEQDHLAHIQVLLDFMQSPILGMNPLIAPVYLPKALKHAAEHICYYYVKHTVQTIKDAAGVEASELMSNDYKVKVMFDQLLALASQKVTPALMQAFQGTVPVLQKAMQLAQQFAPKPPMDPALAAVQAAGAETSRKTAKDAADHAIDQAELETKNQNQQAENAIEADRNQATRDVAETAAAVKLATTAADNRTALDIAETRITAPPGAGKGGNTFKNGESMTRQ